MAPHLVHSHAKEGDIPGTVNLAAAEGDDTAYGQALFPVPAEDPNDPLQWPKWKKTTILVICSLYSFLSNTALLGPAVYITIFAAELQVSPVKASELISYPTLVYGIGTLVTVPMYLKFGRRPILLGSIVIYFASLIGCSQCTSFGALMACRIIQALSSGICEAIPVQLVNDIFFLHERGTKLGIYTVCLCWGSTGPLYAGYMLAGGYGWQLFFYVEVAFAGALLILAFLFVEETAYKRKSPAASSSSSHTSPRASSDAPGERKVFGQSEIAKEHIASEHIEVQTLVPPRRTFLQTLKPWSGIDHEVQAFMTAARSFTYLLVPSVLWVVATYGIYIGLGALVFNYTFPILIIQPPYNWHPQNSGLIALANIIGYALAIPFTFTSDRLAAHLTTRNAHIREAEFRLGVLLPAMLIAPCGLILYGLAAHHKLHWICYFVGVALVDWSSYFYFTFTLAYAVDSYTANTSELVIAQCLGKSVISFAFGLYLLEWVEVSGYAVVVAGVFTAVLAVNNLALVPFMVWGKRVRVFYQGTWLARMHGRSATVGMVA